MNVRTAFGLALALSAAFLAPAASAASPAVEATARLLVTKYTLGDNIRILIETETPKDYAVEPPSEKSDLSPFELKKIESSPVVRGKNRIRRTFALNVTVFEKGSLTFPAVAVRWRAPDGRTGEVRTAPIPVEIVSVGRRPSDKDDIRPIKGPFSFGSKPFWTALEAILAAVLSLALALRVGLRRLRRPPEDESTKPPQVRARLELERLKDKDWIPLGRSRDHAAGLADILRRYAERRFGVDAMEKTTQELAESMKARGLDRGMVERLKAILERADLIKFAKEEPARAELEAFERSILALIDETAPPEAPGKAS